MKSGAGVDQRDDFADEFRIQQREVVLFFMGCFGNLIIIGYVESPRSAACVPLI